MSDPDQPTEAEILRFEVDQADVELAVLWRVVFGDEPKPASRRRALARLWGAALCVNWPHGSEKPKLPVGLVLLDGGVS